MNIKGRRVEGEEGEEEKREKREKGEKRGLKIRIYRRRKMGE